MKKVCFFLFSVVLFSGCSEDAPEPATAVIDSPTLELKYDQEHQFKVTRGEEELDLSTFTWTSSDEKIGTIDATGKFEARKIGETTITGTDGTNRVESQITVTPYVEVIQEPIIDFGATKETIKSEEERSLMNETEDAIAFEGAEGSMTKAVIYTFGEGKMEGAVLQMETDTATAALLGRFIAERYPDSLLEDDALYSVDDDKTMVMLTTVHPELGLVVIYTPYEEATARRNRITDIESILNSLEL